MREMNLATPIKRLAPLLALSICPCLWGVEVSTNPVGFYKVECPANSDTHISIPVTRPPVFEGKVASVSGSSLIFEGESALGTEELAYEQGVQPNHYYAIFKDGPYEGAWFDVVSNTASSVVLECAESVLTSELAGSSVQIIPHWTLNTLMPNGAGTHTAKNAIPTSLVLFYSPDLVGVKFAPTAFFFSDFGADSPYSYWCKTGDIDDEGNYFNQNDFVIPPNSVIAIRNPQNRDATALSFSGNVKMFASDVSVGILASSTNQNNILASLSAVPIKLSDLTDSLIGDGLMEKNTIPVDLLLVYDKSKVVKNKPLSSYYYYYAGEGNAFNGWYKLNGDAKMDDLEILSTDAVYIRKAAKLKDPYVNSSTFTPNYLQ